MRTFALNALMAASALVSLSSAASAQGVPPHTGSATPKVVVELFTSQGCSSCPAADAVLGRVIAERRDVVGLTLATNIWDYLGWKDTLSSSKLGARHKAYAHAFKDMLYTPQAVINGREHINGADEALLVRKISALGPVKVPIRMWSDAGKLNIEAGAVPGNAPDHEATLWLAVMSSSVTVPVTRGENSGKTLTYYNVVRELTPVGVWHGKAMTAQFERASIMRPDTDRAAVLLQEGQSGPIIGAAMLDQF